MPQVQAFPKTFLLLLALGAAPFFGACQEDLPQPPKRAVTPLDPTTVGTVYGTVLFSGSVPEPAPIQLGGWSECRFQHQGPVYAQDVLVKDGRVQNALVYIKEGLEGRIFAIPQEPAIVDQKGCTFIPRIVALQAYQPLRFLNSDPLAHNVHGRPKNSREWNFSLGVKGASRTLVIDKPEVAIEVVCDIHPWMRAYIAVLDHPYFALSKEDGSFALSNLPPGQYILEAWHERLGTHSQKISLEPKETREVRFVLGNPASTSQRSSLGEREKEDGHP